MNKDGLIRIQFLKNGQTKEIGLFFTFEQAIEALKRQIELRNQEKKP